MNLLEVGREALQIFILVFLHIRLVHSQCPEAVDIDPCTCAETNNHTRLYCWGNMQLSRLIVILQKSMCGRTVEKFELSGTNITHLPNGIFSKMIVTDVDVYSAKIRHFSLDETSAFDGLEDTLNSLSMRRCFLMDHHGWSMIAKLYSLSYLDLSYNELTRIPLQWIDQPPPNLRSLLLKGNKISILEPGALKWMYSLVELDLSENRISSFFRNSLPISGNSLIILRLSYNRLEEIPEDAFDGLLSLRRIYLDNNSITRLQEPTWRPLWGDLDALDLNGNTLQCDNSISWMVNLRSPNRLYGECAGPNLLGRHLKTLTVDDFEM